MSSGIPAPVPPPGGPFCAATVDSITASKYAAVLIFKVIGPVQRQHDESSRFIDFKCLIQLLLTKASHVGSIHYFLKDSKNAKFIRLSMET